MSSAAKTMWSIPPCRSRSRKRSAAAFPTYAHHSLLTGADGKGLSKRLGSLSIASMRENGLEAMAVVSHAALLGTSDNIHPCADYAELVEGFDLHKLSRAPARFDEAELAHLNAKLLHHLPWEAVKDRLAYGARSLLAGHPRQHRKACRIQRLGIRSSQIRSSRL